MECEILRRGAAAGTLTVTGDGLYRVLHGRIRGAGEILRLYLGGRSFGVFVPEDGAMVLRRRVSAAQLPELPGYAVAWCEADGRWLPDGTGLRRWTPEGWERAAAWRTDAPMDFPAAPQMLRARRIEGADYLVASFAYEINR